MNLKLIKNTENINKEKITLFCLPFAGGGASAYNQWAKKMQGKVTGMSSPASGKGRTDHGETVYRYAGYVR